MNGNFSEKRIRNSTFSLVFTVVFITIVILFNFIFGRLASKFGWYGDMTEEKVFTLSDEAKEYIEDVKSEVNIYFASESDMLMANSQLRYVYTTACQLQTEFENIHVECHDVVTDPGFFKDFYKNTGTNITQKSVVMASGTESIVFTSDAFFTFNESGDMWAYNGEYRFISGIMQLTQSESPIVYFTTGHSEDSIATETEKKNAYTLASLFYDCGFEVREIDLSAEEIDADARIIVIYNPKYDFIGADADGEKADEISKIDEFLDGLGGVMVFEDSEYSSGLANLNEFLEEWGIGFNGDTLIRDYSHSMDVDAMSILGKYAPEDEFGASVYSDLGNFDTMPRSIMRDAMPLTITDDTLRSMSGTKHISSMLSSYDSAEQIDSKNGSVISRGEFPLLLMSYETRVIDNDFYYSYVMACGAPSFASNNYIISNNYGNSDILFSAMKLVGRDRILADLPFCPFDVTECNATVEQANRITVCQTVIAPVLLFGTGIAVLTRRRHS